jgi:hypothetical protein
MTSYRPGDRVIFSLTRHGTRVEPQAREVRPEPHGEGYVYAVDKFWVVADQHDGVIAVRTRRGKIYYVEANDPRLHVASWWQRMIYRNRFPKTQPSS